MGRYALKSDDVLDVIGDLFVTEGLPDFIHSDKGFVIGAACRWRSLDSNVTFFFIGGLIVVLSKITAYLFCVFIPHDRGSGYFAGNIADKKFFNGRTFKKCSK